MRRKRTGGRHYGPGKPGVQPCDTGRMGEGEGCQTERCRMKSRGLTVVLRVGVLDEVVVAPADPEHHQGDAHEEANHLVLEVHGEDQQPGDKVLHVAGQVPRPLKGRATKRKGKPTPD